MILIADDDRELAGQLSELFNENDFTTKLFHDGQSLCNEIETNAKGYNLIILDIKMPSMNGIDACRKIRQSSNIPVLMLTSAKEDIDKIIGLEVGADDYLCKPFNTRELLARVRALLRRSYDLAQEEYIGRYEFNGWILDMTNRTLTSSDGVEVILTAGLYDMLLALVERPQRVLSREQLMDITHNRDLGVFDRTIDVQIGRLRNRLEEDPKKPSLIKTIRSAGYMFCANVARV